MKKTLFKLLACCMMAVMASCGSGDEATTTDTLPIDTVDTVQPVAEAPNGTTIDCPPCTQAALCEEECENAVLGCHSITDSAFLSMRADYSETGKRTYKVSTIRNIVDQQDKCMDHRIILDGDHNKTSNDDIVFKLIKLTAKDKARATPVSYAFPLFKKIIKTHSPSNILFYKGKKGNYNDILIEVIGSGGTAVAHYDLSDIPPMAGTYEEVPITESANR